MVTTEGFLYPDLAQLSGHHEWRHAVVVEHRLQVAVRVELGALDQQQVVHFCEETRVVLGVVRDVHQSVQHRVPARVLAPQVGFLVRVLGQVVHDVRLVSAGSQRKGKLAWANSGKRGGIYKDSKDLKEANQQECSLTLSMSCMSLQSMLNTDQRFHFNPLHN